MLGLSFGLAPFAADHYLVAPMVLAVAGTPMPEHLVLWHGVNRALILSLVTFALGFAVYAAIDRIRDGLAAAEPSLPRTEGWYDAALAGGLALARGFTARAQNGRMTSYLRLTFLGFGVLIWGAILLGRDVRWPAFRFGIDLVDWAIVILIVASVIVVLRTQSRLVAITALGGVGAAIAIVFVLYGAIDVAMTQLFVEILVVVFLAIAMVRLPPTGVVPFHPGNAAVAALLGTGVTATALAVLGTDLDLKLTTFFEAASYPQALGRNIVNVILVDFRGFDTMGEISVIVIAGVAAIAALMAGPEGGAVKSLILSTCTRFLVPIMLALSVFIFWRGHNDPGGGFIGGLIAATAFALLEKAEGVAVARRALRVNPMSMAAFGLGCALVSGVWGGLEYGAFLKGVWPLITIAPDGSKSGLPFGSIFLFDLGVYFVVLGTVCGILFTLEEVVRAEADRGD